MRGNRFILRRSKQRAEIFLPFMLTAGAWELFFPEISADLWPHDFALAEFPEVSELACIQHRLYKMALLDGAH